MTDNREMYELDLGYEEPIHLSNWCRQARGRELAAKYLRQVHGGEYRIRILLHNRAWLLNYHDRTVLEWMET